jgi:hypothetical protein
VELKAPARPTPIVPRKVEAKGFVRDLREADQWSASLSEYRLPDGTEAEHAPAPVAEPQRSLLTAVAEVAAPVPPPMPETPSVEELLRNVQYTVVESSKTRSFFLQFAALVLMAVPCVIFGPKLFGQLRDKTAAMIHPPKPLPAGPAKSASSKDQKKPEVTQDHAVVSSTPASPWKGSSGSMGPARSVRSQPGRSQGWNNGPRQVMTSNGASRQNLGPVRTFAPPPAPVRATPIFAPPQRAVAVSRTPIFSALPSSAPAGTGYTVSYVYSDGGGGGGGGGTVYEEPPAIGYITSNDDVFAASMHEVEGAGDGTPEWMRLPADQWPPIMLHNDGTFRNHAYVQGSHCVLIETGPDQLWLATPTAMLGEQGGVVPPVAPADMNRSLVRWNAILPAHSNSVAEIKSGRGFVAHYNSDCLLMKVPDASKATAAKALHLRSNRPAAQEPLYLVSLSPDGGTQLVFEASVESTGGTSFNLVLENPINTAGFVGGALLDKNGWLAGIVTHGGPRGQCTAASSSALVQLLGE